MEIEFDLAKDAVNLAKHGVSLKAAEDFDWTTALESEDDRCVHGELLRFVALGFIGDRLYLLVFAEGSHLDAVRAISLRRASKQEVRFYYAAQV
jgi:uncharacterized protein